MEFAGHDDGVEIGPRLESRVPLFLREETGPGRIQISPPLLTEPDCRPVGYMHQAVSAQANQFSAVPFEKHARGLSDSYGISE